MKLKLMLIAVVAVVMIMLGLPYYSWSNIENDPNGMMLTLDVTAECDAYGQKAYFTHTQTYDDMLKPGYFEYLGDYWSFGLGTTLPDYPYMSVLVQVEGDTSTRQTWQVAYTYGTTLEWSGEYLASHGDTLGIQLQIYYAQSMGSHISWTEVVP